MKHLSLLMLALCLALTQFSYSQSEYNPSNDFDFIQFNYLPISYTPSQKVNKITFEEINLKNNKTTTYVKNYNSKGKVVSYLLINHKNDTLILGIQEYTADGKMKLGQKFKKHVLAVAAKANFDEKGRITEWIKTNGNKKVVSYNTWKWNQNGNITESVQYKRDTTKIKSKWVYDYVDNNKISTILYNGKGKVLKMWSYQCNQEGEKLEKKEKVTQICRWNKSDDKYLTQSWRSFDEKGKVQKNVLKYNIKDTSIVEHCMYNDHDSLIYRCTYNNSWDKPLIACSYDKKGRKSYEQIHTYENDLITSYAYYTPRKAIMKTIMKVEYMYNNLGMLTEQRFFNHKGKHYKTIKLTYES
jgi:hypothetical protein